MTPAEYRTFMAQRTFYHFTDVRNLDSIRVHDGLLSVKELQRLRSLSPHRAATTGAAKQMLTPV